MFVSINKQKKNTPLLMIEKLNVVFGLWLLSSWDSLAEDVNFDTKYCLVV